MDYQHYINPKQLQRVERLFDTILKETNDVDPDVVRDSDELEDDIAIEKGTPDDELDSNDAEIIDEGVGKIGLDVLAFYKSYRYRSCKPFPGEWGIFVWDKGVAYILREMQSYGLSGAHWGLARRFLEIHEFYHFKADVQALHFAQIAGKPLYTRLHRAVRLNPTWFVEETLANQAVLNWAKKEKHQFTGLYDFARHFMLTKQPDAYANIDRKSNDARTQWMSDLLESQLNTSNIHHGTGPWQHLLPNSIGRAGIYTCPCHLFTKKVQGWMLEQYLRVGGYAVREIVDEPKVRKILEDRPDWKRIWEQTKEKLINNVHLSSLNFKPWPKAQKGQHKNHLVYSVRAKGMRAHLWLDNVRTRVWHTFEFADHNAAGHGK